MSMTANPQAPNTGTMLLDPETALRFTDGAWTLHEMLGPDAAVSYARPIRSAGPFTTVTTMAELSLVVMPTPGRGATANALDVGAGPQSDLADDGRECDFVPLRRPAPRWSIAIDPCTPIVAARKPFIPPSMLAIDDDERTGSNADA